MNSDILSRAIVRLFETERFYAELILEMDRVTSNKIPNAGVCVKDRVTLYVNIPWYSTLTEEEQVAILKHECQHILNDHIPRMKEFSPEVYRPKTDVADDIISRMNHKLLNVAADCSINGNIKNIPTSGVTPKKFDLQNGETLEWYAEQLKNNPQLKNLNSFDDHSLWGESESNKDILKAKIKKAVNEAAKRTRGAGSMTAEDELLVNKINNVAKDWRGDLRRFASRSLETNIYASKKKRNRRYGIMYPGTLKEETLHLGVAIDTSGSVSEEQLEQFMAELCHISRYAKITVVEADSEIKNIYDFDPRKQHTVSGRGGTAYQPAIDYFNTIKGLDGVIYFGDMDCGDEEITKPKYPFMWAIVGDKEPPVEWGFRTKIIVVRKVR